MIGNNLAAIELPFNKSICNENIRNLFKEAGIGSLVKSLMGWKIHVVISQDFSAWVTTNIEAIGIETIMQI